MLSKIITLTLLVVLAYHCSCDEEVCDEKTQTGLAIMFCENIMTCNDTKAEELMSFMRTCFSDKCPKAKETIEGANQKEPRECVQEISSHVCNVMKTIKEDPDKFKDCTDKYDAENECLKTCSPK